MFGAKDLKKSIEITETTVECPVKDCDERVERQRSRFKRDENFMCRRHNIYISPSTFEYKSTFDNLLWKEKVDCELLNRIGKVKRENRMSRDNSEDAVSWNVFRYLEKNNHTEGLLRQIAPVGIRSAKMVYWSYSQEDADTWPPLEEARNEFGEEKRRSSEPDIIVKTANALFFIEAKLTAENKTQPRDKSNSKKYLTGGNSWFSKVFSSDYKTVAIDEKKYELMRFWLIGTWIAYQHGLKFYLVDLVRGGIDRDIEKAFKVHIREFPETKFLRLSWEDIYTYISGLQQAAERDRILEFLKEKTVGYKSGFLQRAFTV